LIQPQSGLSSAQTPWWRDNGPEQNIKIYVNLTGSRALPDATFGQGVFTGTAGAITLAKFGSSG
jgi:hypothetical protein